MGRMYSAVFTGVAVTAQQDFFEITAPSNRIVYIHSFLLSQSTEVGDAQEEGLSIVFKRGATSSGSGGSAVTPVPLESQAGAAGSTVEANNTTPAGTGTIVTLYSANWNVRAPFPEKFTPEERIVLGPSERGVLSLLTTPADSITMSGTIVFEEVG